MLETCYDKLCWYTTLSILLCKVKAVVMTHGQHAYKIIHCRLFLLQQSTSLYRENQQFFFLTITGQHNLLLVKQLHVVFCVFDKKI